ncbi:hypothetical protein ACVWXL_006126 [Bradyrhizobium sp. GM22.5]
MARKPRLRIVNFSVLMTDNILVIDGRKRLFAQFQFAGTSAKRVVFTQKLWRRARHTRTPPIRQ